MDIVFYKTEQFNVIEVFKYFSVDSLLCVEEGVLSGFSNNLSQAIESIYDSEFKFIESTMKEIHIKSNAFNETFIGSSTMETLMELTVFNFSFNQEDIEPVEFKLKGLVKMSDSSGLYLLRERKESDTIYKGVEVGEYMYFYFKRNENEEVLIESNSGSIKRRTVK